MDKVARLVNDPEGAREAFMKLLRALGEGELKEGITDPFRPASEFYEGPNTVDWLVPELIPRGSLSLVAGRPKAGKTLMALNLAVALTKGGDFLNRPCAPARVGIVQLEDPEVLVRSRLKRMAPAPPEGLFISAGGSWGRELRGGLRFLVLEHELDLLIIDPLVLWEPGAKENSAEEMARLMYDLRRVVQLTGCSVLVVHHSRKGEGDHGDSIRGSSAILGAVDVAIELLKEEEGRAHLRVISRFGVVEDEALELDAEALTWQSLGPAHQVEARRRRDHIIAALEEMGEATAAELLEIVDIPRRTLYRDLNALEGEGFVSSRGVPEGRGKPARKYFIVVTSRKCVTQNVAQNNMAPDLQKYSQKPILCQRAISYIGGDLAQNPEGQNQPLIGPEASGEDEEGWDWDRAI